MNHPRAFLTAAWSAALVACSAVPTEQYLPNGQLDLSRIPREIRVEPDGGFSAAARFLLLICGERRMWVAVDRSMRSEEEYDLAYIDYDGDGDLSGDADRLVRDRGKFMTGPWLHIDRELPHACYLSFNPDTGFLSLELPTEHFDWTNIFVDGGLGESPGTAPVLHVGEGAPLEMLLHFVDGEGVLEYGESESLQYGRIQLASGVRVRTGRHGSTPKATWSVLLPEPCPLRLTVAYVDRAGTCALVTGETASRNYVGGEAFWVFIPASVPEGEAQLRVFVDEAVDLPFALTPVSRKVQLRRIH